MAGWKPACQDRLEGYPPGAPRRQTGRMAFGVTGAPVSTYTDPNPPPLRAFYWVEVE